MLKNICLTTIVALTLPASTLFAAPLYDIPVGGGQYLDVAHSVGSGEKTAYFVVDFAHSGGSVYAFAYSWDDALVMGDEQQTADNALFAIDAATPLIFSATNGATGVGEINYFINSFSYPPSDSAGPFMNDDFWSYYLGDYNNQAVNWSPNFNFGISGREFSDAFGNMNSIENEVLETLLDGGFYGFAVATFNPDTFETTGDLPRLPTAVPEPATWLLGGMGLLFCLRALQRRDTSV